MSLALPPNPRRAMVRSFGLVVSVIAGVVATIVLALIGAPLSPLWGSLIFLVLAAVVFTSFAAHRPGIWIENAAAVAALALVAQVVLVRPRLARRSDAVLAGGEGPRSRAHWGYIALEIVKVIALLIAGVLLLAA